MQYVFDLINIFITFFVSLWNWFVSLPLLGKVIVVILILSGAFSSASR